MGETIRRARPGEAEALTALMHRSKASWGYQPDLMERFAADLRLLEEQLADEEVWVLEDRTTAVIGMYQVARGEPAILQDLWLEPRVIGSGQGRRLWEHAVATARRLGSRALELDADPHAQGFYERMGARVVGQSPSTAVPGRTLPRMRIDLG